MAWARRRRPEAEKSADPAKARATVCCTSGEDWVYLELRKGQSTF